MSNSPTHRPHGRQLTLLDAVVCLAVLAAAQSASATTMIYASIEEMTDLASVVGHAVVVDTTSTQSVDGLPVIRSELRMLDVWSGDPLASIVVEQLGSFDEFETSRVVGDAVFEVGQHVVVFARTFDGETYFLTHLGQSVFEIDTGDDALRPDAPASPSLWGPRGAMPRTRWSWRTTVRSSSRGRELRSSTLKLSKPPCAQPRR